MGDGILDDVVLVDAQGRDAGQLPKAEAHHSNTPLHRGFSVYIFNGTGEVLITRRALGKQTWPGVWTNSCCGHPRLGESGADAVHRRVYEELGIWVEGIRTVLPDFHYRAVDASGVVENEICPVFVAYTDAESISPDPDEVEEWRWVDWSSWVTSIGATPEFFSPWAAAQVPLLDAAEIVTVRQASGHPESRSVPTVADTLAGVDLVLRQRSDERGQTWRALIDTPHDDVLEHNLSDWLAGLTTGAGKRYRPTMCHWGFVASGGMAGTDAYAEMIRVGAALELLHVFALVHDDIMDESDTRRGKPSVHAHAAAAHDLATAFGSAARFGESVAILVGDLAHSEADRLVALLPLSYQRLWYDLCLELIVGQQADVIGAASGRRDQSHSLLIARLKSGAYTISRPLQLGAHAAGAGAAVQEALHTFGHHLGEAFALRDDLLGVWGDPERTGKPSGQDLSSRKPTLLWTMAEERLPLSAQRLLTRVGTERQQAQDVKDLQDAMRIAGIEASAEDRISRQVEQALAALNETSLTPAGVDGLRDIAARIAWREQ